MNILNGTSSFFLFSFFFKKKKKKHGHTCDLKPAQLGFRREKNKITTKTKTFKVRNIQPELIKAIT
jgi:hypothetical protein